MTWCTPIICWVDIPIASVPVVVIVAGAYRTEADNRLSIVGTEWRVIGVLITDRPRLRHEDRMKRHIGSVCCEIIVVLILCITEWMSDCEIVLQDDDKIIVMNDSSEWFFWYNEWLKCQNENIRCWLWSVSLSFCREENPRIHMENTVLMVNDFSDSVFEILSRCTIRYNDGCGTFCRCLGKQNLPIHVVRARFHVVKMQVVCIVCIFIMDCCCWTIPIKWNEEIASAHGTEESLQRWVILFLIKLDLTFDETRMKCNLCIKHASKQFIAPL